MSKQKTLKGSFSLFGKGLHTGLSLTVTFNPAPENTGYKIQRIDLEGQPVIDAIAENVVDTQRGTVLAKGDIRVSTKIGRAPRLNSSHANISYAVFCLNKKTSKLGNA